MNKPFKIHLQISDRTACAYYRAVLPHRHCHEQLLTEGIQLDINEKLDLGPDGNNYDAFLFHRVPNPTFFPMLFRLSSTGKKLIWDLDDDLFDVPEWSTASKSFTPAALECLTLALSLANIITVSTEQLAHSIAKRGWGDKIMVMPNMVDPNDWKPAHTNQKSPDDRLRIIWAGSDTHIDDLKQIIPAVKRISEDYKNKVQFIFMGYMPQEFDECDPDDILFMAGTPIRWYPSVMQFLRPDIGLAPLTEHGFNDCKSNIKYLEYTMAGAATIASEFGPYGKVIKATYGLKVFGESSDMWYEHMRFLINNHDRIEKMVKLSKSNVMSNHSYIKGDDTSYPGPWIDLFRIISKMKTG